MKKRKLPRAPLPETTNADHLQTNNSETLNSEVFQDILKAFKDEETKNKNPSAINTRLDKIIKTRGKIIKTQQKPTITGIKKIPTNFTITTSGKMTKTKNTLKKQKDQRDEQREHK